MGKRFIRHRAGAGPKPRLGRGRGEPGTENRGHALALAALAGFVGIFYWDYLIGARFIWEDALRYYYPLANNFCSVVADGRFPFWSEAIQNGMPLYTDVQAAFLYTPLWVLVPFAGGGELPFMVYQWYIVLHVLVGGVFMYWFLARHRLRALACLLGAMVFCFAGFTSLHVIHVPMLQVHAWLPLQLLLVEKCVENRCARHYALLTVALLLAFFAGFPQVMLYDCLFLVAYWLYRAHRVAALETPGAHAAIARRLGMESLRICGVFASVLLLAAVQILPTIEHWDMSQREKWGYDRISDQSMPWHFLVHLLVPNFFGMVYAGRPGVLFWGDDLSVHEAATYKCAPWQYHEFGAYAGQLAIVAIAGLALNWKRTRRDDALFFVGGWLVALWFMLGRYGGLFGVLYHVVPGVALFRGPARMACVLDFCAAVMVAFFVASWIGQASERPGKPLLVTLGVYVVGAWCYFAWGERVLPKLQEPILASFAWEQMLLSMLLFAGIAACLWGLRGTGPRWRHLAWGAGLAVLTFVDLQQAYGRFHKGKVTANESPHAYFNRHPAVMNAVESMSDATGPTRFVQMVNGADEGEYLWDQNTALMHEALESPRGYTTFVLRDAQMFRRVQNHNTRLDIQNVRLCAEFNPAKRQLDLIVRTNCLPRAKFYSRIKAYESDEAILRAIDSGGLDHQSSLAVLAADYGDPTPPLVFNPFHTQTSVTLTRISPECSKIKYAASRPGVIFLSRSFYPGWEATDSDGRQYRVIRAFIAFTGIVIPTAGSGEITLRFRPASFRLGAIVSATTALALVAFYVFLNHRQQHAPLRIR